MSFLSLPAEVRLQIYDLTLAPSRLCVRSILDPEWLFASGRGCQIAPLLFVNKQIYHEAAPIFYSKATLEVTPCQRNPTDARGLTEFMKQYEHDHSFCPSSFMHAITSVHVYGEQAWPVDQNSFHALFQWLISNTGVRHIYLSRKTMQQSRHISDLVCLNNLPYDTTTQQHNMRVVDVYARNVSSRLRFRPDTHGRLQAQANFDSEFQLYFSTVCNSSQVLYREPLWSSLLAETDADDAKQELLKQQQERFANDELSDAYLKQAHNDGFLWLYKTIQIHCSQNCLSTNLLEANDNSILVF